ncbi:hypothetical protein [Photorhabdus temperata]|uniref:Phage tail protein C-terminal domain-containing protein n=1 Tax=Photorhabdus temperata J3 TaxID=1389415 RepID=U7QSY7_PHOTE|nr:hypothetical protein [Photorhabdus temperata]ERT10240.1 hypothetical protein O185_26195 [Photorhabdus temperata J3]
MPGSRKVNGKALSGDISLSAGDVGAFSLGLTGRANAVPWNTDTGLYELLYTGFSEHVAHFYNGSGSCPAFQLKVNNRNSGIAYRSARDSYGFEEDWTSIYTTRNKPSAEDVGAFPGVVSVNSIPTRSYVGPFSGEVGAQWAKGINIGQLSDVGQIYVNVDGNLYAYFLNSNGSVNGGIVWSTVNAKPDANGNLRVSSPVVDIHPDGTYELTSEAEGVTVKRIDTGKYRISGCNGFAKDGAWGIHGGTIVPADSNGLNLIWVNEYVDTSSGDITIECYHRQNTDAPKFAQNKRVKSITATGEVVYYNDGELCDIPDGRVINVRVQMPASDDEKAATVPVPSDDDPASPSA